MPRDGSGDFSRSVTPPVNGDVADADDYNSEQDDVADALSDSINKDGTKAFAANQSMGGFLLRDLPTPSAANDAARKAYVDSAITAAAQPLDATLTALAALSWASGNALVQFTAADTVSLTLTPSVSSVTASQGAANTTPSGTFVNTTDAAAVRVVRFESDRATPTALDTMYASYFMSNGSGAQVEMARETILLGVVTAGSELAQYRWGVRNGSGALADVVYIQSGLLGPTTDDGAALGAAASRWSDLFLAEGGVINWDNGDLTLTQTNNVLALAGGTLTAQPTGTAHSSGTIAAGTANTTVTLSGDITLDDGIFAAGDRHEFDPGTSNRTFTRASGLTMYVNGVDSASATLAANQLGYAYWRTNAVVVLSGAFV